MRRLNTIIDEFFDEYQFDYLDTVTSLLAEFTSMAEKDIVEQNIARCEEYCNLFAHALARGVSNPPPEEFPNIRRMGSYEFDYEFEFAKSKKYHSEYQEFIQDIYQAKLRDVERSKKFKNEILPNFSNVGVVKKKFVSALGYRMIRSDRESIDFEILTPSEDVSWNVTMDKSNTRSPKHLTYFFGVKFGDKNSKHLHIDLSLIDFRLAFLPIRPFVEQSNYSKKECLLMENYASFVHLKTFPIVAALLESYIEKLDLPKLFAES